MTNNPKYMELEIAAGFMLVEHQVHQDKMILLMKYFDLHEHEGMRRIYLARLFPPATEEEFEQTYEIVTDYHKDWVNDIIATGAYGSGVLEVLRETKA